MTRKRRLLFILLPIAVVVVACAAVLIPYCCSFSASATMIRIPRDAKEETLRDTLEKYYDKSYADKTMTAFNLLGRKPSARFGAYEIPEGTSPAQAARTLSRGAQTPIRLTINGVRELDSFLPRVAAKFPFSLEELQNALYDEATLKKYGLTAAQAPALFLNDTYYVFWTASAREVVEKLGDNYNKVWSKENRAKAEALGLTPAEIMTIASITDEETQAQSEKGRIGRLYINRLKKGMKLQADPTVRYAIKDFTIRRVTNKHLQTESPYNTYRITGLPPGPIRTTSKATIEAILNSSPSEDLFMCAKEDFSGTHNFASTYEEHLQNAKRYQQALDERGIR